MTTFIADFIFGPRSRSSSPRPSLADRLMARLRSTEAPARDAPRATARTDDTGSPSPLRRPGDAAGHPRSRTLDHP